MPLACHARFNGKWLIVLRNSTIGLAAYIYNGFAVVKINAEKSEVVETYSKHKHGSLAYRADW